jgi:hypothetical protein
VAEGQLNDKQQTNERNQRQDFGSVWTLMPEEGSETEADNNKRHCFEGR